MKQTILILTWLSLFLSCSGQKEKINDCNEIPKALTKTWKIKVGGIAPGITGYSPTKDIHYSFGKGIKGLALLYFPKTTSSSDSLILFYNDEVPTKGLWKEVKKREAQVSMTNDIKLAVIYGCYDKKKRFIDSNYLIFINDGIVEKIYKDVSLESVKDLLIENYP